MTGGGGGPSADAAFHFIVHSTLLLSFPIFVWYIIYPEAA